MKAQWQALELSTICLQMVGGFLIGRETRSTCHGMTKERVGAISPEEFNITLC